MCLQNVRGLHTVGKEFLEIYRLVGFWGFTKRTGTLRYENLNGANLN